MPPPRSAGVLLFRQREPLYVVRIDPEAQRLVVGPRRALAVESMRIADWNWIGEQQSDVAVKVRSLAPAVAARVDGDWVAFVQPEYGVAPGQAAVVYDGTRVLGGGWIAETVSADARVPDAAAA
jgi:tRNA-specific 2-thiouridylase